MLVEFGEPESVLNGTLYDYTESFLIDGIYEPPVSLPGLYKSFRANGMHSSAIYAKRNIIVLAIELNTNGKLSRVDLDKFLLDFGVYGNGYLQAIRNPFDKIVKFKHLPALYMRRRSDPDCYSYVSFNQKIEFKEGSVFHFSEYDPAQEIYGIPEYFATLSSVWLNEDATLFRRKYYKNGAHSGFLLYMNNPKLDKEMEDEIKQTLNSAKGLGNFKNLFINGRGQDKEKPELIPVGQINAKDEFASMKNVTTADILSAHRIPIELMSVVRENMKSGGDLNKVDRIFNKNEIQSFVERLTVLNDFAGEKIIELRSYESLE
ncbi:phage portal protein [Thiomicrorhabdus sp.]|uniref:phage portal protein n=1 Tax=Thiomicrorhabdus sp. TaxID=2039724 RepID=UPI00356AABE3